jgi:regulator of replication initiation timing
MATPEGLCTACSATGYCQEHICLEGHPTMSEPMDLATAHRCIDSCAKYLAERDESPRAAKDLRKAVSVVTTALRQQVEALTADKAAEKHRADAFEREVEALTRERDQLQLTNNRLRLSWREDVAEAKVKKEAAEAARDRVCAALRDILELGRKDLSNPKYDSYYEEARAVLTGGE